MNVVTSTQKPFRLKLLLETHSHPHPKVLKEKSLAHEAAMWTLKRSHQKMRII